MYIGVEGSLQTVLGHINGQKFQPTGDGNFKITETSSSRGVAYASKLSTPSMHTELQHDLHMVHHLPV